MPANPRRVSASTIAFDLGRVRDLAGRSWHPWGRRLILLAMLAFVLVGLAGVFGQVQRTRVTDGPVAKLTVRTPEALRGGLYWPAEIRVKAHRRITAPVLVLGAGYIRGMQLNTVEPAPVSEASRGGRLAFTYPTLEPGDDLVVRFQLQVNPTTVGEQDLGVRLESADTKPVDLPASARVLP